jgi:hypothetical protein
MSKRVCFSFQRRGAAGPGARAHARTHTHRHTHTHTHTNTHTNTHTHTLTHTHNTHTHPHPPGSARTRSCGTPTGPPRTTDSTGASSTPASRRAPPPRPRRRRRARALGAADGAANSANPRRRRAPALLAVLFPTPGLQPPNPSPCAALNPASARPLPARPQDISGLCAGLCANSNQPCGGVVLHCLTEKQDNITSQACQDVRPLPLPPPAVPCLSPLAGRPLRGPRAAASARAPPLAFRPLHRRPSYTCTPAPCAPPPRPARQPRHPVTRVTPSPTSPASPAITSLHP